MELFRSGSKKVTKFIIHVYKDKERHEEMCQFPAMFNPDTLTTKFSTKFSKPQGIGRSAQQLDYVYNPPEEMKVKLILDDYYFRNNPEITFKNKICIAGTKLVDYEIVDSTRTWVKNFRDLCWIPKAENHAPLFLQIEWAGVKFPCRLSSVEIKYTRFNPQGNPTAAELDIAFKGDCSTKRENLDNNFSSPDLTHMRIVNSCDTLPLLCQQIYGDSSYYPTVAQANGLDNFRNLQLGQKLYFPPLT